MMKVAVRFPVTFACVLLATLIGLSILDLYGNIGAKSLLRRKYDISKKDNGRRLLSNRLDPKTIQLKPTTTTTSQEPPQNQQLLGKETSLRKCDRPLSLMDSHLFKSQGKEDRRLLTTFFPGGLCGGVYLEMGALDGIKFSNTFVLRHALDWKGILIESNPESYQRLVRNRPNELAVVHAAVCDANHQQTVHYYAGHKKAINGIWEFTSPAYRDKWWKGVSLQHDTIPIQCQPLSTILQETTRKLQQQQPRPQQQHDDATVAIHIDYFSLDVEGAELEVLRSIDWSRVTFGTIMVEGLWTDKEEDKPNAVAADNNNNNNNNNNNKNDAIHQLLQQHGYRFLPNQSRYLRELWFIHEQFHEMYHTLLPADFETPT